MTLYQTVFAGFILLAWPVSSYAQNQPAAAPDASPSNETNSLRIRNRSVGTCTIRRLLLVITTARFTRPMRDRSVFRTIRSATCPSPRRFSSLLAWNRIHSSCLIPR